MRKIMRKILCFVAIIAFFTSCQEKKTDLSESECLKMPNTADIKLEVKIERLDKQLFSLKTKKEIAEFLKKNQLFTQKYLQIQRFPSDTLAINEIYNLISNKDLQKLQQDCDAYFGEMKDVEKELTEVFKNIKAYYPTFNPPKKIYTMITGYGSGAKLTQTPDLVISPEIVVIGLEFFLGKNYKYQPPYPDYISRRYNKKAISIFIAQAIGGAFNLYNTKDQTALAEMIFYGKSFYFMQSVVPCLADSTVLGYTKNQMDSARTYKEVIWTHYVDKKIFYQTSHFIKKDYVEDTPFTLPISQEWCPGAIGKWTGLRIIKKYMQKHPETNLTDLMKKQEALQILEEAGYRGE
jgi:hypothetical protein